MKVPTELDPLATLEKLNKVGIALSDEKKLHRLLNLILEISQEIIHADGGTIYLINEHNELVFSIIRNHSLNIKLVADEQNPLKFPAIPLYIDKQPNLHAIASYCALEKKTVNIPDAYLEKGFDFSGAKTFDQKNNYRTKSVLAVPLINHQNKVLGVMQLVNCMDSDNQVTSFSDTKQKLAESLASQAAISVDKNILINKLENLIEGISKIINVAIDEKSPHTSGHCERVPELTLMLAEALSKQSDGVFADFHLSEEDLYELKIASLLHDCGKITTPVHVVDKATKLETIFDRIKLVELKAELLKKDLKIKSLEAALGQSASNAAQENLNDAFKRIDEDLAFIQQCNYGSEKMQDEDIDRIKALRNVGWLTAQGQLEPLLSDNEVENLTIRAGTLTQQEREVINNHIRTTIKLLEQLDWPDHLKNVAEFAGGHHERMDGRGYPKGLTKNQMSIQARVMGVADIFEALTAADRPYKKAMPLSQSLAIMERMSQNGHIDPDIFEVFIKEKIFLKYAKQYLNPEQVDIK